MRRLLWSSLVVGVVLGAAVAAGTARAAGSGGVTAV
jgi:hypothetical protein